MKVWKRPKTGKPSNTVYDDMPLTDLIKKRDQLQDDMKQLFAAGWADESKVKEHSGLTAETARANYRTLALEHSKVESAYFYVRDKN